MSDNLSRRDIASVGGNHGADGRPVLIIVMGTSGSGKSTLGARLAAKLGTTKTGLPFIDGDDLHPASNVAKMARGEPLDDTDREPWLHRIRERALRIVRADAGTLDATEERTHEDGSVVVPTTLPRDEQRALAEVFETSAAQEGESGVRASAAASHEVERHVSSVGTGSQRISRTPTSSEVPRHACVIACSALKRSYRDLLRGDMHALPSSTGSASPPASSHPAAGTTPAQSLRVLHVYARTPPLLLLARMRARKNHFMHANMLRSQLETLEEPNGDSKEGPPLEQQYERDVIVLEAVRGALPPAAFGPLPEDDASCASDEQQAVERQLLDAQRSVDELAEEAAAAVRHLIGPLR